MSTRGVATLLIVAALALMASGCGKGSAPPAPASNGNPNTKSVPPSDQESATITVYAAASLTDILAELSGPCEAATGLRLRVTCGASSTMAKQIDAGARADLFLSANAQWVDWLVERQRTVGGRRQTKLAHQLVVVAPLDAGPAALELRADYPIATAFTGRLALGDPSHVPAGMAAQQWLVELGWWDALAARQAPAADVRAALRLVELGECELGVVYASDAASSDKVRVLARREKVSESDFYCAALPIGGSPRAVEVLNWLSGPEATAIFSEAGFIAFRPLPQSPPPTLIPAAMPPTQGGDHAEP